MPREGCVLRGSASRHMHPSPRRQTEAFENITFPQLRLRTIIINCCKVHSNVVNRRMGCDTQSLF